MRIPLEAHRRVVPRWRDPATTSLLGELSNPAPPDRMLPGSQALDDIEAAWRSARSGRPATVPLEFLAAEFIGSAIVAGKAERARDAVTELRDSSALPTLTRILDSVYDKDIPPEQTSLAIVSDSTMAALRRGVSDIRHRLNGHPRDPIGWSELARLHTILGASDKAEEEMRVALQMGRDNRYLLRSAARFLVHVGDPERAHDLLAASDRTPSDPWLLASEIALASTAQRRSGNLRRAKALLASGDFGPFELSELAAAVGTEELSSGGGRRARQLLRRALDHPHENALAQVEWANQHGAAIGDHPVVEDVAYPFEALALEAYVQGEWEVAARHAASWQSDQPFSSQPAVLGSYLSTTLLHDFERAEEFCVRAMGANPGDVTLSNNYAVALASLGRADEASRVLKPVSVAPCTPDGVMVTATRGLIAYRSGNYSAGRSLYAAAIDVAVGLKNSRLAAVANVFACREELRVGGPDAERLLRSAQGHARGLADRDIATMLAQLGQSVHTQMADRAPL